MTLAFILTRLSGDLAISIAGPNATQADIEAIRKAYGLDRPVLTQFFDWVGRAADRRSRRELLLQGAASPTLIAERMPVTLTLGLTGLVIALRGLAAARHPGRGAREHRVRPRRAGRGAARPGDAVASGSA